MSKFVKVNTQLRDLNLIKQALGDLRFAYEENGLFVHRWSGFRGELPIVVRTAGTVFGLQQTDEGVYEVLADDMQMRSIEKSLNQIQQRYAYHKVLADVEEAGFSLVEESTDKGQVIRMTVRRWS